MSLKKFCIILNTSSCTYAPGQYVSGKVVIDPGSSAVETLGLLLIFKGDASVSWTEHRRRSFKTVTINYHDFSNIIDYQIYLLGDGKKSVKLSQGENIFPFSFRISSLNIPGTFHGSMGKVEYVLKATLKRKGRFTDCKTKKDVFVTPILNLNMDLALAEPKEWETLKTFGCLCCVSGPLTMLVKLRTRGFCVGDSIPFFVEVNNGSTRKICNVAAQLIQEFTYTATPRTKQIYKEFLKNTYGREVGPGKSEIWRGKLAIPGSAVPTRLGGGCTIIDVQYYVKVVAQVFGTGIILKLSVPVTIGTVPIQKLRSKNFWLLAVSESVA